MYIHSSPFFIPVNLLSSISYDGSAASESAEFVKLTLSKILGGGSAGLIDEIDETRKLLEVKDPGA